MISRLKQIIAPPTFPDDAALTENASVFHAVLLIGAVVTNVLTLDAIIRGQLAFFVVDGVVFFLCLLGLRSLRQRRIKFVRLGIVGAILALSMGLVLVMAELNGTTMSIMLASVVFSSMLLGQRGGWVTMFSALAAGALVYLNGRHGWWRPLIHDDAAGQFITFIFQMIAVTTLVNLVIGNRERALARAKASADAADTQRNMLEMIIDAIPDYIFVQDTQQRYLYVNKRMLEDSPYLAKSELIGKSPDQIYATIDPEGVAVGEKEFAEVMSGHPVVERDEPPNTKKDQWTIATRLPLRDSQGVMMGVVTVLRDITRQKRVEQELRALFVAVPDTIFVYDRHGTCLSVQTKDESDLVAPVEDIVGRNLNELLPAPLAQEAAERIATVLSEKGRATRPYEYELHTRAGHRSYESRMVAVGTDRVMAIVRDITERRQVERDHARLAAIVSSSSDIISISSPAGEVSYINPEGLRTLGYDSLESALGLPISTFHTPRAAQRLLEEALPHIQSEPVWRGETEMRRRDGTTFPALQTIFALRSDTGAIKELATIIVDITERKRAEAELHDRKERLTQALRAAQAGAWEWNMITGDTIWSEENFHVMGLDPARDRAGYDHWLSCVHPDDRDTASAQVTEVVEKRSDLNIEFRVVWPDRSIHWLQDVGRIVFDAAGNPVSMFGIQMDITRRKRAESEREALITQLEAKNAELERFTYTVSHDLKSPLITIRGFLGYLVADAQAGHIDRLQQDIRRIENAADKMQRLLEELLELSRIGRKMNQAEAVPFGDIVSEALLLVQGLLTEKAVRVAVEDDLPWVYGDRVRLVEVMQNLMDNAAKFMGDQPHPCIEIGTLRGSGDAAFFVRDNGIGIEQQYLERVFGLFEKLDANSQGTGVGLALVKRIIEVHGGKITAESDGLGKGTTFYFTLPAPPNHDEGNTPV